MMYSNDDYRCYLAHHGVVGMHWGIRRYQPYGEGYIRKDGKTGSLREYGTQLKRRLKGVKESKGLIDKYSYINPYGSKAHAVRAQTHSEFERKRAEKSKTRLMKAFHTQHSINSATEAKHFEKLSNKGIAERYIRTRIANPQYFNEPYRRLSGRTTSAGKRALDAVLTGGLYGTAKDIKYLHDKKRNIEPTYKQSKISKKIDSINRNRHQKSADAIQKDIDSFKPYRKTGISTKKGALIISADEVNKSIAELEKKRDKHLQKANGK